MSEANNKGNVLNSPSGDGGMEYNFRDIEKKWQDKWKGSNAYKVENDFSKPKCYVLDMFPYPSGAGLHVGHPLGYIASDIYSRYKRLKGFNVLHPMGYDAFGLPAEQYAIDHGIHPAVSTANNIQNFRSQLDKIGFSFDWDREVNTSKPEYYKWTQWIFLQLFNSYFCHTEKKARPIADLEEQFMVHGSLPLTMNHEPFTAEEWKNFEEKKQQDILMKYRLAYCGYGEVNWCEALGTVLANDEVINGVSERGGYPVVKKTLRQWYLRITEYADRLLEGLEKVDFSEAMKEMQTNWIGKSSGAEIDFEVQGSASPRPSPGGEGGEQDSAKQKFFKTADDSNWHILKEYGRTNRKNPTEAEDILWQRLRNNQLGAKVRRQHTIQGYIVDFAILEVKLVIEVDGEYHNDEEQKIYDNARTKFMNQFGLGLLRFTNEQVIKDTETVIKEIETAIEQQRQKLKTTDADGDHSPSPPGEGRGEASLRVYTTRPDTIFGVDFMVIAPEHELVEKIKSKEQSASVDEYITYVKSRSERERMAEKKITGVFTGSFALNPFNGREIPIWISEYVLAGYGTGAIMGVPCGDERDHKFAKHFNIPITNIIGDHYNGEEANPTYEAKLQNSDFLNGIEMRKAIDIVITSLELAGIGKRKVNYKMRDAAFSRQRYWGEPFPIIWKDGIAYPLPESELPLTLPEVKSYSPGPDGEGPLANIKDWINQFESEIPPSGGGGALETNTMPGYAGSSWYFLRYMDPHNDKTFCDRKVSDYWNQVDIYIGGTEHAVGHLLYSRMWTKVLYDLGLIGFDEPYKRLVNQGMIQGSSRFVHLLHSYETKNGIVLLKDRYKSPIFLSNKIHDDIFLNSGSRVKTIEALNNRFQLESHVLDIKRIYVNSLRVDVNIVDGVELNIEEFKKWRSGEYANAEFILEDDRYICGVEVEKMSKSKFNTVNPDDLVVKYGADTFRMYEMFLGPVEMSKPWDTKGIEGVHRFLKKFWRLFFRETKTPPSEATELSAKVGNEVRGEAFVVTDEEPTAEELKALHHAIKKIESDTERFSFNTAVSAFMIATNELTDLKCHKRKILEPLLILLTPYAPHIAEELWSLLGNKGSILHVSYPEFEEKHVKESSKTYPIAINGKTRTELTIALDATQQQVEEIVLADATVKKWLEGKTPKKIIYVKNKMVNLVV